MIQDPKRSASPWVGFSFSWRRFGHKPVRNFFLKKFDTPNRAINGFSIYLTGPNTC
jgi:hypothetical protein